MASITTAGAVTGTQHQNQTPSCALKCRVGMGPNQYFAITSTYHATPVSPIRTLFMAHGYYSPTLSTEEFVKNPPASSLIVVPQCIDRPSAGVSDRMYSWVIVRQGVFLSDGQAGCIPG